MSEAEEKALEKYPVKEHVSYGPYPGAAEPCKFDDNKPYRIGFIEGYHQAEKELELTWGDVNDIKLIIEQVEVDYEEQDRKLYTMDFYQEVLKRFKAQNGK